MIQFLMFEEFCAKEISNLMMLDNFGADHARMLLFMFVFLV